MFLYLGGDVSVYSKDVVGIFDIEECSVSRTTADFLNSCQKKGVVVSISEDMPKCFVVTEKNTFITNVSHNTIRQRGKKMLRTDSEFFL